MCRNPQNCDRPLRAAMALFMSSAALHSHCRTTARRGEPHLACLGVIPPLRLFLDEWRQDPLDFGAALAAEQAAPRSHLRGAAQRPPLRDLQLALASPLDAGHNLRALELRVERTMRRVLKQRR